MHALATAARESDDAKVGEVQFRVEVGKGECLTRASSGLTAQFQWWSCGCLAKMATPVGLGLRLPRPWGYSEYSGLDDGKRKKERKPQVAREGVMDGISLCLMTVSRSHVQSSLDMAQHAFD